MELIAATNPILRTPGKLIDFDQLPFDLESTIAQMFELMDLHKGIGLAAPQVGLSYQLFIIHIKPDFKRIVINPKILTLSDEIDMQVEGCLSFPFLQLKVKRPASINVSYQNVKGEIINETLDGLKARCFLHEKDHVDGICFDTRVGKVSLQLAKKKQEKLIRSSK